MNIVFIITDIVVRVIFDKEYLSNFDIMIIIRAIFINTIYIVNITIIFIRTVASFIQENKSSSH